MANNLTDDERQTLLKAGPRLCSKWGISDDDAKRLLGDVDDDRLDRTGALVSIHIALMVILGGDTDRVRKWLSAPNQAPFAGGLSAIQAMIEGGLPAMTRIRRHLEAEVAG